jgi:AGZA family xanthine/uracil permease-like MFS transporter
LDSFFKLRERGTDARTEVMAGIATFMTMAYIIFVNPNILFGGADNPMWGAAVTATCLAAGITTILMGVIANWPLALAAGMGLNAFVAFGLVAGAHMNYYTAMGVIVVEGLLITVLVLTKVREKIMDAIPMNLKRGIGVGIGLFIAFIGLVDGGLIKSGDGTLVTFSPWDKPGPILTIIGIVLSIYLMVKKVRGSLLWGILATTGVAIVFEVLGFKVLTPGALHNAASIISLPTAHSFATIGHADIKNVILGGPALWGTVFAVMMTDFFDTMGTVVSIGEQGGLLNKEGKVPNLNRVLLVDSLAAMLGGFFGISSNTTYVESAAGVGAGGRTGLSSVITGLCFFAAIFFTPVIGLVPSQATAPALILVGFLMIQTAAEIDFGNWEEAIPAFLTIIGIPLTYSIARGVGMGFVAYVVLKLIQGKVKGLSWLVWIVSILFLIDMFGLWTRIFG